MSHFRSNKFCNLTDSWSSRQRECGGYQQSLFNRHWRACRPVAVHSNRSANTPVSISRADNAAIKAGSFFPRSAHRRYVYAEERTEGGGEPLSPIIRALSSRNYATLSRCRILGRLGPIESGRIDPPSPFRLDHQPKRKFIP